MHTMYNNHQKYFQELVINRQCMIKTNIHTLKDTLFTSFPILFIVKKIILTWIIYHYDDKNNYYINNV